MPPKPAGADASSLPDAWKAVVAGDPATAAATPATSNLPDAWKDVASDALKPAPPPTFAASNHASLFPRVLPVLGSLALLGAGAAAAWTMQEPDKIVPVTASSDTPPTAGAVAIPSETLSSRTLVLASAKDLLAALIGAGLTQEDAAAANGAALGALGAATGDIRAVLNLATDKSGVRLIRLEASHPDGSGAVVSRTQAGDLVASKVVAELSKQILVVRGELDTNSFYSSAVAAGVIDSLIPEFINAFAFDFDLQQEVNPGDIFEVAYEQTVNANGEPLGQPQLVFASLTTPAKRRALYRYTPPGGEVGWYDGNGGSTVRSFMRTPVDGARISSKFGYRIHPIYGYSKLHGGTDFAAPQGTPIYASGDAVVEFAGLKGCNGNFTRLHHDNGWYTHYLHQVRFAAGIAVGARVTQGQVIGYVGTTGCSTGPHLHYEVVIEGQKVDPLSIKTESGRKGLEGSEKDAFIQQRDRVDVARARQAQ